MGRLHGDPSCIYDRERNFPYRHEAIQEANPEFYEKLLEHRKNCEIKKFNQAFWSNRHIVFCPSCNKRIGDLRTVVPHLMKDIPEQPVETVGLVGFGSFGQFISKHLVLSFDVAACDIVDRAELASNLGVEWQSFEEVAQKDAVVLSVPLGAMEAALKRLSPRFGQDTLVIDVCSVKARSMQLIRQYVPQASVLATHPLFGPQSVEFKSALSRNSPFSNHKMVVCPSGSSSSRQAFMLKFFAEDWRLRLVEMSAEEHDRQMAMVQGLTHFIARGLKECGVERSELATTAFQRLCDVTDLLGQDSWELFETIQNGNPFAGEVRRQFRDKLEELEERLNRS